MQNSIWKLTALAGVIGIGFLIAWQTLHSLDKDKATAQNEVQPETQSGNGAHDNATGLWQSQSEPQEPAPFAARSRGDMRLVTNDQSQDDSRNQPASFEPFDNDRRQPATTEPQEFPRNRRSLPDFDKDDRSFLSDNTEPPIDNAPRESAKAQATRLVKEAREALNLGQLQTARALVIEALDLPVVYGQFEERPEHLLKEIDGLLKAKSRKPVASATVDRDPDLELLKSTKLDEPPTLNADVTADLFSNKPEKTTDILPNNTSKDDDDLFVKRLRDNDPPPRLETEESLPLPDMDESDPPTGAPRRLQSVTEVPRLGLTDDEPGAKPARLPVVEEPQTKLVIRKDAPPTAKLNEAMIYSMTVENRGTVNAAEVTVEDEVPPNCDLVGSNPQAGQVGQKLTWKLGRIEVGQSKVIRVKVIPRKLGNISTLARVSSVAEAQSEVVPMSRQEVRPTTSNAANKLRLNVTGPQSVPVGETVTLKFKLSNTSDQPIADINLQNLIPAGFIHTHGNDLSYGVDSLAGRGTEEVELELKAVKAGRYVNRSIIQIGGKAVSENETRIEVLDPRGLRVETSDAASMPIGQPTVQEIRLINEASAPATGVVVTDELPADLKFIKATHNGQYDPVSRRVRWQLDSIAAGETALLKLTVQPKTAGPHSCVIDVTQSGQRKLESVESRVKARGIAGLKVDLDHAAASVLTGEDFTVEARIRNRGNGADTNISFALLLPPELEFVQSRGPVRHRQPEVGQGQVKLISFNTVPELGERAEAVFEITLRAKAPGKAKMRAEVTSDDQAETILADSVIVVLDGNP